MTVGIRPFRVDDTDALIALFRHSVRRVALHYSEAQRRAWAPDRIDRQAFEARRLAKPCWVATIDGAIAGFTDLDATGHIDMFFVSADFQRRGVAAMMLQHVEAEARRTGTAQLMLEASETARGFFERNGFVSDTRQEIRRGDETLWNYPMKKLLG